MSNLKSKRCSKCRDNKPLTEFSKDRTTKDGLKYECKSCRKDYRKKNKESINERRRKQYEKNSEFNKKRCREYWQENKEVINERRRKHYEKNRYAYKEKNRNYRQENKEYFKRYHKERYANDPKYRTSCLLRRQTQRLGDFKNTATIELVGCSPAEFWIMNGSPSIEELQDLHIDHVVPMSWFDLSNEDHLKVCNHYINLQYLSSSDNLAKGGRYMGSPDNILAYKEDFDIDAHVAEMLVIIDELN